MFKHLMSKKLIVASTVGTLAGALAGSVSADEVVRSTERGGGSDVISDTTAASSSVDQTQIDRINEQLRQLAAQSNGLITINEKVVVANDDTIKDFAANADKVEASLKAYKEAFDTYAREAALHGREVNGSLDNAVVRRLSTSADFMERFNEKTDDLKAMTKNLVETPTVEKNPVVDKAFDDANKVISERARELNNSNNGVLGDYDKLKRSAEDSKATLANGGIALDVDTTGTQTVSNNKVDTKTLTETVQLDDKHPTETIAAITAARDKVLKDMEAYVAQNSATSVNADNYVDTALKNKADVEAWLQKETARVRNVRDEIAKNTDSVSHFKTYKGQVLKTLDEDRVKAEKITNERIRNKTLAYIDEAKKVVSEQVDLKVKVAATLKVDEIDFGNLGRSNADIMKIANDTTASITKLINDNMVAVKTSNKDANDALTTTKADNDKQMKDFHDQLEKALKKPISQIDEKWVEARQIYGQSDLYKTYIKKAMAQTQDAIDGVVKETIDKGGVTIKRVDANTSAATASAAEYQAQSKNGFDNGFGSPMVPSLNVNDFATVRGHKAMNSQTDGGAQKIIDTLTNKNTPGGIWGDNTSQWGVIQDVVNQHMNVAGANNVLLVASLKPEATFDLKDSFAYVDEDGKTHTANSSLKLTYTTEHGTSIGDELRKHYPTSMPLYLFYLSVDPKTGALVAGGGYIPTSLANMGASVGDGGTNINTTSDWKLRLGAASDSADDTAVVWGRSGSSGANARLSTDIIGADTALGAEGIGGRLNVSYAVDNAAGKWAQYAPLYISDIDDGQYLALSKGAKTDVFMSGQGISVEDAGTFYKVKSSDLGRKIAATGTTNIDSQSVLVFGKDTQPDSVTGIAIGHGPVGSTSYHAIDVSLFAPFGVVGSVQPKVELKGVEKTLNTFAISDLKARAHTDNKTTTTQVDAKLVSRKSVVPPITGPAANERYIISLLAPGKTTPPKVVASNTSMVVRQLADDVKRTASGNSLTVRTLSKDLRTASGNSLTVRTIDKAERTASGNSMTVRTLDKKERTASGNSLAVRALTNKTVAETVTDGSLKEDVKTALVTANEQAIHFKVYVEPEIRAEAEKALTLWADGLAKFGTTLDVTYTDNVADLASGVDLAILAADNKSTRVDVASKSLGKPDGQDEAFEMADLAGLMSKLGAQDQVALDPEDKFNRSGTISDARLFGKTTTVIQMNTQAQSQSADIYKTLAHEIGHVFGLEHDDEDPLMSTYSDAVRAVLSDKDIRLALKHFGR